MSSSIGRAELFRYACLALPLAFAGLPIYLLAPDYYAVHQGLSLAALGSGLLLLRVFDAFLDPILGRFVDRWMNYTQLISYVAVALLSIGFFMLFSPPALEGYRLEWWFYISVFIVTLGFSVITILYGTVGALWPSNQSEQTLISTSREAVTLIGLILSISLPFLFVQLIPVVYSYLLLIAIFLIFLIPGFYRYQHIQKVVLVDSKKKVVQQKSFSLSLQTGAQLSQYFLYGTYSLSSVSSAIPAVLIIFFVRDYLGSERFVAVALIAYFLAGAISMPFWHKLAHRIGKVRTWQLSMFLAILSFTWVCLLSPGDFLAYFIICGISGLALGAEMALPPAILSEQLSGESSSNPALRYSGLTMISKIALALAAGTSLYILDRYGFMPNQENDASVMKLLLIMYGALPGVLKCFALALAQVWIVYEKKLVGDH